LQKKTFANHLPIWREERNVTKTDSDKRRAKLEELRQKRGSRTEAPTGPASVGQSGGMNLRDRLAARRQGDDGDGKANPQRREKLRELLAKRNAGGGDNANPERREKLRELLAKRKAGGGEGENANPERREKLREILAKRRAEGGEGGGAGGGGRKFGGGDKGERPLMRKMMKARRGGADGAKSADKGDLRERLENTISRLQAVLDDMENGTSEILEGTAQEVEPSGKSASSKAD
jgi:hypothetical protein